MYSIRHLAIRMRLPAVPALLVLTLQRPIIYFKEGHLTRAFYNSGFTFLPQHLIYGACGPLLSAVSTGERVAVQHMPHRIVISSLLSCDSPHVELEACLSLGGRRASLGSTPLRGAAC